MTEFLLVAVDGTLSRGFAYSGGDSEERQMCVFHESYTRQFHAKARIASNNKYFDHGPDSAVTGWDSAEIEKNAWRWLAKGLERSPHAKVILVGHSRGGHIVTNLALRLSKVRLGSFVPVLRAPGPLSREETLKVLARPIQRVLFLGLYDAVDMTTSLGDTSTVPENVDWCYHAIRSKKIGSRRDWGNTALNFARKDDKRHLTKEFGGTHGSMGGAIPEACAGNLNTYLLAGQIVGGFFGRKLVANALGSCEIAVTEEENASAGREANEWMLAGARKAGVPI